MHVMIDTETLGVTRGSVVLSVGAVLFDPYTGEKGETFYRNIDEAASKQLGLREEQGTLDFWAKPENAGARKLLRTDTVSPGQAMLDLAAWWKRVGARYFWCHGAGFDDRLLEGVYDACMLDTPWQFWDVRCCRTVLAMARRKPERVPRDVKHHALDDARAQVRALVAAFKTGQWSAE